MKKVRKFRDSTDNVRFNTPPTRKSLNERRGGRDASVMGRPQLGLFAEMANRRAVVDANVAYHSTVRRVPVETLRRPHLWSPLASAGKSWYVHAQALVVIKPCSISE